MRPSSLKSASQAGRSNFEAMEESVLGGQSPATNFEVRLLELSSDGRPSLARTLTVFRVFDEVLPYSGIFQKVLRMVRDELFESVFSDQYSSTKHGAGRSSTDPNHSGGPVDSIDLPDGIQIGRIPYFTLIQTLLGQRGEASELLQNEIDRLGGMLSEKATALERIWDELGESREEVERIRKVISNKDENIARIQGQNTQLQEDMSFLRDTSALEKRRLTFENNRLQEKIDALEKENGFLEEFKQGYDSMHDAFIFRPGEDRFTLGQERSRKPVLASKKNQLLTNIRAAKKLEEQLLEVQNQCIAEFDSYLEKHKQILQSTLTDSGELAQLDVELNTTQDRFTHTIGSLQEELGMIRQHLHYLESELDSATTKPVVPKPPSRVGAPHPPSRVAGPQPPDRGSSVDTYGKQSQTSGKDSILSSADNFENVDLLSGEMDPFIPQEAILSKYSITVLTSTDSKESFHQLMDAKFCPSCCEVTVVCPHKVSREKVITLPHNCTHIKLTRPRIKIPAERKQRSSTRPYPPSRGRAHPTVNDVLGAGTADMKGMLGRSSKQEESAESAVAPFHKDSVTPGMGISSVNTGTPVEGSSTTPVKERGRPTDSDLEHTQNPLFMIWDDYIRRTDITRSVPKPMNIQQCLSLISQFYAQVLWSDEQATETDEVESVVDYLYHFFEDRYMLEDVTYLCMHDFISAIVEYSSVSKSGYILVRHGGPQSETGFPHETTPLRHVLGYHWRDYVSNDRVVTEEGMHIQLFCHVMVGNLDAATFRYLLVVGDLIDRVTWKTVGDFKVFIRLLYPFLNEDEVDQQHLAYTSFSENRVSRSLVHEYFMYAILKYREPKFRDVEAKLLQRPMKEFGLMSLAEFIESVDALSPLVNEKLGRKLYAESERHYSEEGKVSVARLAQIGSYLLLLQDAALLRQKVADEVVDGRFRALSLTQGTTREDSLVKDDIMTTAKLRSLAKKLSLCEQSRRMRRAERSLRPNNR